MDIETFINNYFTEDDEVKPALQHLKEQGSSAWRVIYNSIMREDKTCSKASTIKTMHSLGIKTFDDFKDFDIVFNRMEDINSLATYNYIEGVESFTKTPTSVLNVVVKIKNKQYLKEDDFYMNLSDREYYLLPEDRISEIIKQSPAYHMNYISENSDCDDFANRMKVWFTQQGIGNIALGTCVYEYDKLKANGEIEKRAHAVNIAITNKRNLILIEPQLENYWKFVTKQPFHIGHDNMKIRQVLI